MTQNTIDDLCRLRAGEWMNGFTDGLSDALLHCEDLCFELNSLPPSRRDQRADLVRKIVGRIGERFVIHSPFRCDFGFNISIGENFAGNFNLTILDEAEVRIGDNVFIGPNTTLCTITHALDYEARNSGIMKALPITIGNNVWIASNVVILPGVTIGDGAVIGAGSVVTRDVAPSTLVVGSPAREIRRGLNSRSDG